MQIAIVGGSGKMGRWFARFLRQEGMEVIITGRSQKKLREVRRQLGVETTTNLEAIRDVDVVLISVPIDNFEEVVQQIEPHLNPKQIVADITSVKVAPVEIMHRYIKKGLVLGTHPVFGPGAKNLANQNFVLTPTNEPETNLARKIRQFLETRDARVTLMTPQEHDDMMSVILGLAHFIGIVSADTLLNFDQFQQMEAISGSTYKLLLTLAESVISEDAEFYASLQMNLPKASQAHQLFQRSARRWADIVKNRDQAQFVRRMTELRAKLEKTDPAFQKAYENMYRLLK